MDGRNLALALGFSPKNGSIGVFHKTYANSGYTIEIDFEKESFDYGRKILSISKTTLNFSQAENWVILECVDRLLEKGYQPENIILEKTWPSGHGTSGRLDILVTRADGTSYLMIECKTYGSEYDKALKKLYSTGGQLFAYFQQDKSADVIMLYASELKGKAIVYKNEIVKIEEDYRLTNNVKDFHDRWSKLTKGNGVFDSWVKPYDFQSKALTPKALKEITQEDSGFIFNQFLEILRHNVVSDKPNAFNKIFTLFLCKIYDEKATKSTEELAFQWFYTPYQYEGISYPPDDNVSFQKRLTDLYKKGMKEFLEKDVTDISDSDFETKYASLEPRMKALILNELTEIRLKKNNEFAIKEVFDDSSFEENAKVVKEVVELLQGYRIRYNQKQQYLSDFFELLLTTGLKQESGQFFTPVPIAQFIIKSLPLDKIVAEKLAKGENDNLLPTIIDYAAGSGHFVTESMHEVQRIINKIDPSEYIESTAKKIVTWKSDHFDWAFRYVYGIEKDYRLVKVGKVGCYLHGDGLAQVIHSDGLGSFSKTPEYKKLLKKTDKDFPADNKQFDIVVSNPPYSVSAFKNNASKYYSKDDFELYERLTDQSSEIECLFVERTKQLLKDDGVAGIILPSSILNSTSGIYTRTREIILQYFKIIAIAEMGSNTFMATGTNTVVLFLLRRNNYESKNIRDALKKTLADQRDNTINGIERPISQYLNHVWGGIQFADYLTLFAKMPSEILQEHDIYKDYNRKIVAKTQEEKWKRILESEEEKLFYFILTFDQRVVLVKTGEKNDEKAFLGYEFSYRRGYEGIHSIQRGKKIDECTRLFDPERFDNPERASTYIYKAFQGQYEIPHSDLKANIHHLRLIDMLTFDRVDFEKNISLAIKKKRIESKWKLVKLEDIVDLISGQSPDSSYYNKEGKGLPFYQGKTEFGEVFLNKPEYWTTEITKESIKGDILMCVRAPVGPVNFNPFEKICIGRGLSALRVKDAVDSTYLFYLLKHNQEIIVGNDGAIFQSISREQILNIKIPLPSLDVQKAIVKQIGLLDEMQEKELDNLEALKQKISDLIDRADGQLVKLTEVTTKIGSGATPRGGESAYVAEGVSLIRSQNVHDNEFVDRGLAFIDEEQAKKLNNVTVQENDILFNITGASVCRCCIVDKNYLPARVNQHVSIIRANDKVLPIYLQKILISTKIKAELLDMAEASSTREAITKGQLEEFKIPLPSLAEQQKIVSEIMIIEKQIASLKSNLDGIPEKKKLIFAKYL